MGSNSVVPQDNLAISSTQLGQMH